MTAADTAPTVLLQMSPFEQAAACQLEQQQQSPPAISSSSGRLGRTSPPPPAAAAAGGADGDGAAEGAAASPASSPGGSGSSLVCAPLRGPGAATASSSRPSLDVAHRFRHSLDLELMRQTSSQDLRTASLGPASAAAAAAAAAAASAAAAGTTEPGAAGAQPPSRGAQTQQQQLPKLKTRPEQQSPPPPQPPAAATWSPLPGTAAAAHASLPAYLAARRAELVAALGPDEGVSSLIEASADVAAGNGPKVRLVRHDRGGLMRWASLHQHVHSPVPPPTHPPTRARTQGVGWLVSHEEELGDCLSLSMLLAAPPRSPGHAASRDAYLATLDFVEALCETSSSLTRFTHVSSRRALGVPGWRWQPVPQLGSRVCGCSSSMPPETPLSPKPNQASTVLCAVRLLRAARLSVAVCCTSAWPASAARLRRQQPRA
jgi:hypothetical protein